MSSPLGTTQLIQILTVPGGKHSADPPIKEGEDNNVKGCYKGVEDS